MACLLSGSLRLKGQHLLWLTVVLMLQAMPVPSFCASDSGNSSTVAIRPLKLVDTVAGSSDAKLRLSQGDYFDLRLGATQRVLEIPLSSKQAVRLQMERFSVTASDARFVIGTAGGDVLSERPDIVVYRGKVEGEENSHAYFAVSSTGMASGYLRTAGGETYFISQSPAEAAKGWNGEITVSNQQGSIDFPDGVVPCAVEPPADFVPRGLEKGVAAVNRGMRMANVAIDSDNEYYQIFDDLSSAQAYILIVLGAVSDIYMRDLNMKLMVKYVRVWPSGGEPFEADNLGGFADEWRTNEDPSPYNYVHMFSGRRDLPYGGVAFVGGTCSGIAAFGISGFLNGSFPAPFGAPSNSNWDVIVVAHEMGHNSGTFHTHDGYTPTIDDCGNGTPSRGTIMSYCHSFAGYTANTDIWMHTRVEAVIEEEFAALNCYDFDCNGNDTADVLDIARGRSTDVNFDGIPDECQDCNGNSQLDPAEIAGGAPDIDDNGILDICESDCNNNNRPDHYDIFIGSSADADGNNTPDECDPDCNGNSQNDWVDTELGSASDYDRNAVPDECQDCNNNSVTDMVDLHHQYNLFVADQAHRLREFHRASGYPITEFYLGISSDPTDIIFSSPSRCWVSDQSGNRIMRVDVDSGTVTTFLSAGLGGLSGPTFMLMRSSNGNLLVASRGTSQVLEYNGTTGAFSSVLVTSGSGGLSQPYGMAIAPNGNLVVASGGNNSILEYNAVSGGFVRTLVSSGSGGLSQPRGIAYLPNGNLIVASFDNSLVLQYNGTTGAYMGVFTDLQQPSKPFGVRLGPNGNIFVSENSLSGSVPRIFEFLPNGRFYRRFVRGSNSTLENPTGFAFRPASNFDCNRNYRLDVCDISGATSLDANFNGIPDECETIDIDGDGVVNGLDNCPAVANADQQDLDFDDIGDVCDNCAFVQNYGQVDSDGDLRGDACDNCPQVSNPLQENADNDLLGDICDPCIGLEDLDNDGICGTADNCPYVANLDQADADADGLGDVCDACPLDSLNDADGDGDCANLDNCPTVANANQADADADGVGNLCDNCPNTANPGQEDADNDGVGNVCEVACGDINGSGSISISDVVHLINYIFAGGEPPASLQAADVNCSGQASISDAVYLIRYIFSGGPAPCAACP